MDGGGGCSGRGGVGDAKERVDCQRQQEVPYDLEPSRAIEG